ncbi:MAG: ATP-binding protein [Anaerolineae bacterium]|jgi:DNA replication protein DnaC
MKRLDEVMKETGDASSKANMPTISNTDQQASEECPLCGGLGYVREEVAIDHPNFGKMFPCRCKLAEIEHQRMERLRSMSNLDHLARMTFDTFVPEGYGLAPDRAANLQFAFDMAYQFANNPKGWLILLGGYGCGKTHLAAAIANHVVERGQPVLFVVVPDLLDHLRATFAPNSPVSYDERFEEIRNAPLLILDDFGTQSSTSWAQEKLFQLLNYRYNARLPTVITSNYRMEEIDLRIRSRMVDPDLAMPLTINAPDFRQTGVAQSQSDLSSLSLMQDMTFDRFDLREDELSADEQKNLRRAFDLCRSYAEQSKGWLVLTGDYGCGKTHLAAAIANYQAASGQPVLFVVVPDLLDHLRATFSPSSQARFDKRFEEVRTAPLLVLDDLGTQSASPWAQEKLYQLFNHRYNARLATVITMAQPVEEVDPRLRTRMLDRTRCRVFAIVAPSYRGIPATKPGGRQSRRRR